MPSSSDSPLQPAAAGQPAGPQRRLERLCWPELRDQARRPGSTVLWPFGSTEQHGPHLPLCTDALFADRLADAVLERLDPELPIWRLPVQSLGFSPEHLGFAGTLTLPAELLIGLVVAVGRDLEAAGFDRLVFFNGHGGQVALLEVAARQLRASHPRLAVLPCMIWRGPEGLGELLSPQERSQGLHAGQAETSLMLHLAPELVGVERRADGLAALPPPPGWSLEGAAPSAWLTREISRWGVVGVPAGSSAELGRELFERLVEGWCQRLEALLGSAWPATPGSARPGEED